MRAINARHRSIVFRHVQRRDIHLHQVTGQAEAVISSHTTDAIDGIAINSCGTAFPSATVMRLPFDTGLHLEL